MASNNINATLREPSMAGIEPYFDDNSEILFIGSIASIGSCEG